MKVYTQITITTRLALAMCCCLIAAVCSGRENYEIHYYNTTDGLPSNLVSCFGQDSNGLLWLGTWRGLCCFDGYEFISFNNVGDENERPLCSRMHQVRPDPDGNVWCLTYDRRLYLFQPSKNAWTDVSAAFERKFGKKFQARNLYTLDSGVVWLTCYEGENLTFRIPGAENIDDATEEYEAATAGKWAEETKLLATPHPKLDLSAITGVPEISKFFIDSQQNIWSYGHQLIRITPRNSLFTIEEVEKDKQMRTIPAQPDIDGSPVYAAITDSRGREWRGTKGSGLYMTEGGRTWHFTHDKNDKYSLTGNDVYDIFEDSHGRIWVGCYDYGLNLYEPSADSPGRFINNDNLLKYPADRFLKVRQVTETAGGTIILSTADGIVAFDANFARPEEIKFYTYTQTREPHSLPGGNVMQVLQASNGRIYISTMSGLFTVKDGELAHGDARFEPVQGTQNDIGIVLAFIEDNAGHLWLARENYIERYDMAKAESVVFGIRDFGSEVYLSEAWPVISYGGKEDRRITFGTYGGTMSFNPDSLSKSTEQPPIIFTMVQYQGSAVKEPILYTKQLDVPSDKRDLTIYFAALDYQDNDQIQYAYKLVGKDYKADGDEGWTYIGRSHCASFNNLPAGHLRLLVKSTNADGVWSGAIAELPIYSHPTFWETPWALLLYVIIVAGLIVAAVAFVQVRNRHRRQKEELEWKLQQLLGSLDTLKEEGKQQNFALKEVQIEPDEKLLMEKLMAYLDENIGNSELKIGDLSEHVGLSRSVFYERVKAITGMSPVDFVRYLRMQKAKQLLSSTGMSVAQISYEVGFSEPTYFGKVFKQVTGQSPLNYRKSAKEPSSENES